MLSHAVSKGAAQNMMEKSSRAHGDTGALLTCCSGGVTPVLISVSRLKSSLLVATMYHSQSIFHSFFFLAHNCWSEKESRNKEMFILEWLPFTALPFKWYFQSQGTHFLQGESAFEMFIHLKLKMTPACSSHLSSLHHSRMTGAVNSLKWTLSVLSLYHL